MSVRHAWLLAWIVISACGNTAPREDARGAEAALLQKEARKVSLPRPEAHFSWDACTLPAPGSGLRPYLPDDSRHQHAGIVFGLSPCTPGKLGLAGSFDGLNDRVEVSDHPRLKSNVALSVALWLKPSRITGSQTIAARDGSWALAIEDGALIFSVLFPDGGGGLVRSIGLPATLGAWTHVSAVFDGATLSLYVNGVVGARGPAIGVLRQAPGVLSFGAQAGGAAPFQGQLDEARVYDRVLTPEQANALYVKTGNDADADGVFDDVDDCTLVADTLQPDADGDEMGDACDPCPLDPENDRDGDGRCATDAKRASCQKLLSCLERGNPSDCLVPDGSLGTLCESPEAVSARHALVTAKRAGRLVYVHRGSSRFAQENTLEAYRASFELGADGNEFDVRQTRDGVLVVFHDPMLDFHLRAFGDVADYTWEELQRFAFRNPGRFGNFTRIPTLAEVLELHLRYAGFVGLDLNSPGLGPAVAQLLSALDMWDQVGFSGDPQITGDPRYAPIGFRDLTGSNADVDPASIAAAVASSARAFFVNDPRGVAHALGRSFAPLATQPYRLRPLTPERILAPAESALISLLTDAPDWDVVYPTVEGKARAAEQITARAMAADLVERAGYRSSAAQAALDLRARERSLHQSWRYMGLDGQLAELVLLHQAAPAAVPRAREIAFRDDPLLDRVLDALRSEDPQNPSLNQPRAALDWREKNVIWPALASQASVPDAFELCHEVLFSVNSADQTRLVLNRVQPVEPLLRLGATTSLGLELLQDAELFTRGEAVLGLLALSPEPWAYSALAQGAPYALAWIANP